MKKNKLKYFTTLFLVLVITISCNEEFLEPELISELGPENVLVNAEGFEALTVNLRRELRWEYDGQRGGISSQIITTDVGFAGPLNTLALKDLPRQFTPSNEWNYTLLGYFEKAYDIIKTPNAMLQYVDNVNWSSDEEKNRIIATAYFYRSYWYYTLIHLFGDVPFVSKLVEGPKRDFYTHSRKTILNKIEEDMEFAVQWLPQTNVAGGETSWAGYHLLAKIQLANSHFDEAVQSATQVINGPFSLVNSRFGEDANDSYRNLIWDLARPQNVFDAANTETILGFVDRFGEIDGASSSGSGRGTMRDYLPVWWDGGVRDSQGGRGSIDRISGQWTVMTDTIGRGVNWVRGTPYYNYDVWDDANDLRRSDPNWVDKDELVYNNPSSIDYLQPVDPFNFTNPADSIRLYYAFPHYKTFIPHSEDEGNVRPDGGFGNGYIYRLAGTHLLRAEANYWLGKKEDAAMDINAVRNRAGATSISGGNVTIQMILAERAKELFTEEPRKVELTRIALIMADNNLNGYSIDNVSSNNFYYDHVIDKNVFYKENYVLRGVVATMAPQFIFWPIPAVAITNNSQGVINQNEGFPGAEQNLPPLTVIDDRQ